MPGPCQNVEDVAAPNRHPRGSLARPHQRFNGAGKDEERLRVGMAVQWHAHAGRDRTQHDASVVTLRLSQKLNRRAEHIEHLQVAPVNDVGGTRTII
jgi:hypothetical protein